MVELTKVPSGSPASPTSGPPPDNCSAANKILDLSMACRLFRSCPGPLRPPRPPPGSWLQPQSSSLVPCSRALPILRPCPCGSSPDKLFPWLVLHLNATSLNLEASLSSRSKIPPYTLLTHSFLLLGFIFLCKSFILLCIYLFVSRLEDKGFFSCLAHRRVSNVWKNEFVNEWTGDDYRGGRSHPLVGGWEGWRAVTLSLIRRAPW